MRFQIKGAHPSPDIYRVIFKRLPLPLAPAHLREGILMCNVGIGLALLVEVAVTHLFPSLALAQGILEVQGLVATVLMAFGLFTIGITVSRLPASFDRLLGVPYTLFMLSFSTVGNIYNGTGNASAQVMTILPGVFTPSIYRDVGGSSSPR